MSLKYQIPEPLLFNPLKHYLPYIREYTDSKMEKEVYPGSKAFFHDIRQLGRCVMDIYTGELGMNAIFTETKNYLELNGTSGKDAFSKWVGTQYNDYRLITLSDDSQWTLKYSANETKYVHIFPARASRYTFRVKANSLKSALLYLVLIGKDFITEADLNKSRALVRLSPIKDITEAEAVTKIIEILRM